MSRNETMNVSATGAQKAGNLERYDLIPAEPLRLLAEHFGRGARKYEDRNWEAGFYWSLSFAALNRHLWQFWSGEDIDAETGSPHIIAVAWHAFVLAEYAATRPAFDDRPHRAGGAQTLADPAGEAIRAANDAARLEDYASSAAEAFDRHMRYGEVTTLDDRHTGREWIDDDGDHWRWHNNQWQCGYHTSSASGSQEWGADIPGAWYGPYTPADVSVPYLDDRHTAQQWIDVHGDRWRRNNTTERWECNIQDSGWSNNLPGAHFGPYTVAAGPDTVETLNDEHTGREWIDRAGHRWRHEHPHGWLCDCGDGWRSTIPATLFGPYTPAPAATETVTVLNGNEHTAHRWTDIDGDTWAWIDGRWQYSMDGQSPWFRPTRAYTFGPFTRNTNNGDNV